MKLRLTDLQDMVSPLMADADALMVKLEDVRRDISTSRRLAVEEEEYVIADVPNSKEYAFMAARLESLRNNLTYFRQSIQDNLDYCTVTGLQE